MKRCELCGLPLNRCQGHGRGTDSEAQRSDAIDRSEVQRQHGQNQSAARDLIDYAASGKGRPISPALVRKFRGGH